MSKDVEVINVPDVPKEQLRTIKCSICGKTRVIIDSEYAQIILNNYLKMCGICELKARANNLPFPYIIEDQGLMRDYINKIRGIDDETK